MTIHQWTSWAVTEVAAPLTMVVRDGRRVAATGGEPNTAIVEECLAPASNALSPGGKHLQSRAYITGDALTLGDINTCSTVTLAPMFIDLSIYPAVQRWLAGCTARPTWKHVQSLP